MNKILEKIISAKNSGFTVIESLVAVSVLAIAILGATTAAQAGLSSYISSKDQVVAFYLAQEGFEQIRNIRDENRLNDRYWLYGISVNSADPCYYGEKCTVSPVEGTAPTRCASGTCPKVRKQASTGFYGYNAAWAETPYMREISLEQVNEDEIAVTVRVTWSKGIIQREFVARENILNW